MNQPAPERRRANLPNTIVDGKLVCPKCGCKHFLGVMNSYGWTEEGKDRRRTCRHCGYAVITTEVIK